MDKLAKYIIIAGITAAVIFLGWYFRTILLYLAVAVVISLIGKPVVKFLTGLRIKNFHFPRWLASALTLALIICVCLSLFLLLAERMDKSHRQIIRTARFLRTGDKLTLRVSAADDCPIEMEQLRHSLKNIRKVFGAREIDVECQREQGRAG